MKVTRFEALKALDDIFNYCEEIDYSLPENERSGYKMLPDIHKIRKYIIENTRPHGEWIPVSERLPEENKTVIASTKYGVYSEARYSKEYGWEWAYESGSDYWVELEEEVNAWMPLPEPYRKEGEAE